MPSDAGVAAGLGGGDAAPCLGCDAVGACGGLSAILNGGSATPDAMMRLRHGGVDAQRVAGRRDTPFDRPPRLI